MHQLVVLTVHKTHHSTEDTLDCNEHGQFHPSIMEGKDTPYSSLTKGEDTLHCSPSQMPLSAATARLLKPVAQLETTTAPTLPSLLTTLLAGGWSCWVHSVGRFFREDSPGENQGQKSKQGVCEHRKQNRQLLETPFPGNG